MSEGAVARLRRRGRDLGEIVRAAGVSHGASAPVTVARITALRAAGGFTAREALHRGLLAPGEPLRETLRRHASKRRLLRAQLRLNPPHLLRLTEDKEVFADAAAKRGLPVPRLIAVVGGQAPGRDDHRAEVGPLDVEEALARDPADAIVVKPAEGFLGRGVRVLRREGGHLVESGGTRHSLAELLEDLRRDGRKHIVQERVSDHPGIQVLNPSDALQTVRFTVLLDDRLDPIMYSWLKLAPKTAEVDNYAHGFSGTVYADVDTDRGVIRALWAPRPGGIGSDSVSRHPATGAALIGAPVPHWGEARALARRASEAFLPMLTIGWDIAITQEGPLLIEGNARWDPPSVGDVSGALLRRMRAARPRPARF